MLKKILVPLDGSALADRILTIARLLLAQEDTEVVLVRVLGMPSSKPSKEDRDYEAAVRARLERSCDELSKQGGRARYEIVYARDPAAGLLDFANELGPSLIISATHGDSGTSRWLRGSVAERLLQRTEQPILLVDTSTREGVEPRQLAFAKILVPLDGSKPAAKVLPLVRNVARLCGSEVSLLHVVQPGAARTPVTPKAAEELLHQQRGKHFEDVKVRTIVGEGNPAAVILDHVEREKPDLVALTTHGQSGDSPWPFGSVAERVLRSCSTPLLVYRTSGLVARAEAATAKVASGRA
jgi:nucleotide-binding universal stress UspA family protein